MINRWSILAVLFLARVAMAFQFQAVAAISPVLIEERALDLASVGFLVGLYLAPGIFVAFPGSALAAWIGERRIVLASLMLMAVGAALMLIWPTYAGMVVGRILAGIGGVVVNIVMTKMLVDWFAGREISTAMAIFINSWPVGIGLASWVLPPAALAGGASAADWLALGITVVGMAGIVLIYRPPSDAAPAAQSLNGQGMPWGPIIMAALIWAFYNAALAMVFSFGAAIFTERGWTVTEAGRATALFMFVLAAALPLGGILADRSGKRHAIIAFSHISFALLGAAIVILPTTAAFWTLIGLAALFALAAGPIMTLPSQILPPDVRGFGMGVFFTIYYAVMAVAPRIGGEIADRLGSADAAIAFGIALALCAVLCQALFVRQIKDAVA